MEEPANPQHLMQIIDMIDQPEFLMFATDYPHWDFDAPDRAIPSLIKGEQREQIMWKNAAKLYGLA